MTRLRLGMVGGGRGAFIGAVHRTAARLDDRYTLVAGALSSDPERARMSAAELGIAPERSYDSYQLMAEQEAARQDGIDVVAIVTPNHLHRDVASSFLLAGTHVICDKPLCRTLDEADALAAAVAGSGRVFALTYAFSGYPMVRQARQMVRDGALGRLLLVQVEYAQQWLAVTPEDDDKQASWRLDPDRGGAGGCLGDIGTHAFHLAEFVSGLRVESLAAEVSTMVDGRRVPDNADVLLRFTEGVRGSLWASQVAVGHENALRFRIMGEDGALAWDQESPDRMAFTPRGQPTRTVERGGSASTPAADRATRVPAGHPEGYLEAFAQLYADAAEVIAAWPSPREGAPQASDALPGIEEGVRGMRFIDAALTSSAADATWTRLR